MHSSPFSVAGMSSSTSSHHNTNLNSLSSWGSSSSNAPTFSDSLSQPRSHYQSGYLMSASQNNNAPQGSPRADEVPTVQTKAKMNHMLSRGSASEFGMDSMFQSSRQRQTLIDEDAPPMNSVNDIPNESHFEPKQSFLPKRSTLDSPFSGSRRAETFNGGTNQPPYYVVVFGYPQDKYSITVDYFKSLGNTTEPDPHLELVNCFKIGYYDAGDAIRVLRKSGETLCGTFMVGVKVEASQSEMRLSPTFGRSPGSFSPAANFTPTRQGDAMNLDESSSNLLNAHSSSNTPSVGTPIRLAPSTSAFRQSTIGSLPAVKLNAQQSHGGMSQTPFNLNVNSSAQQQPNKGLVGQAVDLIFGW